MGLQLLDRQRPDGQWGDGVATPFWWSNMYTLVFLRGLGVDPTTARARAAIDLVRDNVTWGQEFGDSPFFEGEVEPCINGRVVALGAYFAERNDRLVDRLLSEQLTDGAGTVSRSAARCGRRSTRAWLSTGDVIDPLWTQFAFPPLRHYDVLRALDYLRAAGVQPEPRTEEAVAILHERRQVDGRWLLDVRHRNTLHEELPGTVGAPNRWITLRALRVLNWYALLALPLGRQSR